MTSLVTIENSNDKLVELHKRLWEIPFDNSQFQNEHFVLNASLTKERAYRAAALKLQSKLNALIEAGFQRRRDNIEIQKLQRSIEKETDELEKELLQISIDEIKAKMFYKEKLAHDAMVEANQMLEFINSCPEYSRQDFENAERNHFEVRLTKELQGITGAAKSLEDMGIQLVPIMQHLIEDKEIK